MSLPGRVPCLSACHWLSCQRAGCLQQTHVNSLTRRLSEEGCILMIFLANAHQFYFDPIPQNAIFSGHGFKHSLPVSLTPRRGLSLWGHCCFYTSGLSPGPDFSPAVTWWPPKALRPLPCPRHSRGLGNASSHPQLAPNCSGAPRDDHHRSSLPKVLCNSDGQLQLFGAFLISFF